MPASLVFCRKIWGARDNGIPPRSTPEIPRKEIHYDTIRVLRCAALMCQVHKNMSPLCTIKDNYD